MADSIKYGCRICNAPNIYGPMCMQCNAADQALSDVHLRDPVLAKFERIRLENMVKSSGGEKTPLMIQALDMLLQRSKEQSTPE